jgi:hypothetical protein
VGEDFLAIWGRKCKSAGKGKFKCRNMYIKKRSFVVDAKSESSDTVCLLDE